MPKEWEGVTFRIHYLNSWLEISIDAKNNAAVKVLEGAQTDVKVNGKLMRV